jgi:nitrilase
MWTKSVPDRAEAIHKYMANSLSRESKQMERIKAAAKDAGIVVVLGYSERDGGSIYIAQSYIVDGEIVHHRRKIKPTHVERSVWGEGGANSLKTVIDTKHGKIGALCCFEHYQPLLRYYEYSQGAQIHVAAWPSFFKENRQFQGTSTASRLASQFLAIEGQTFVLVATQVVNKENFEMLGIPEDESTEVSSSQPRGYAPAAIDIFRMVTDLQ